MAKKPIKINQQQEDLLRKIASVIADKGMTVPAIFFFESIQPLNYIGSQAMAYLEPFLTFIINRDHYNDIQKILEQRQGINYFLTILEDIEFQRQEKEDEIKKLLKAQKKEKPSAWQKIKALLKRKKS